MATRFSDDDVREILQRAIDRSTSRGDSTGQAELVEIAAELGVSQEDVSAAIADVSQARELTREVARIQEQRRRSLASSVITWLLVCGMLLFIDWMTGPDWWVMWPFAIWGFILVLVARRTYFPDRQRLEAKARAALEKRQKQEERERRRQRQRGFEHGLEEAFERSVTALVHAAARHVDRVAADSNAPPAAGRQRVDPMSDTRARSVIDDDSGDLPPQERRQRR